MGRVWSILAAVSFALAGSALADDLTITGSSSTPVATSNANNGPGDITVATNASLDVTTPGSIVTIDSDNDVTIAGTIGGSAASNVIGVHILGEITSSYTQTGFVDLIGGGSNNAGIDLAAGTFHGSLIFGENSIVSVRGADSAGIKLQSVVDGNVMLAGTVGVFGQDSAAFYITAPILGRLVNAATVFANGTIAYDFTTFDPVPAWGMGIGASVLGGMKISGPLTDNDDTFQGSVTGIGSRPAVLISPQVVDFAGGALSNIVIGTFNDGVDPATGFSIVNRGNVFADGNDTGVDAIGMQISGFGGFTVNLSSANGIYNSGGIRANATSTSFFTASTENSLPADATALFIGAGATVPGIVNDGAIEAVSGGEKGGIATSILIDGGIVQSLVNSAQIRASSTAGDAPSTSVEAYAIRDLSGTLTSINNLSTGNISATASATNIETKQVAADLGQNVNPIDFKNAGSITGDIIFGSGAGNILTIDGARINNVGFEIKASVIGDVRATGAGTVDIMVTNGSLQTEDTHANNISVGGDGTIAFALNRTTAANPAIPLIAATGMVDFEVGSRATLTPTTFLPDSGLYTILSAAGGLAFDDFVGTTALPLPFLYTGGFTRDANNLYLSLQRKSAGQLGLSGNLATIYGPAAQAAELDDFVGVGLLSLPDTSSVVTAMNSYIPNIGLGSAALARAVTEQVVGPIGVRQRGIVTDPQQGLTFWGQQFYEDLNGNTTLNSASFFGSGLGIATGVEWGAPQTGRYGVGFTYFAGQVTESFPRATKTTVALSMLSAYGSWRSNNFFISPQVNAGFASFDGRRTVDAGSVVREATGDWNAYLAAGGVTSGVVLDTGMFELIPQISLDGLFMNQGGYGETGAGDAMNLHLASRDSRSISLFAGVVAQSTFSLEEGIVRPQFLAGWSRELMNDPSVIDASFEALPGSEFSLVGPVADPQKLVGGASFSYLFANWSAALSYDAVQTASTFSQSATVSLTSRF